MARISRMFWMECQNFKIRILFHSVDPVCSLRFLSPRRCNGRGGLPERPTAIVLNLPTIRVIRESSGGSSEIEGKGRRGDRASRDASEFQSRKGISEIEGKVVRVATSDSGSRASFKSVVAFLVHLHVHSCAFVVSPQKIFLEPRGSNQVKAREYAPLPCARTRPRNG